LPENTDQFLSELRAGAQFISHRRSILRLSDRLHTTAEGTEGDITVAYQQGQLMYLVVMATPTQYQKFVCERESDGTAYPDIYRCPFMIELENAWPYGFRNGQQDACPSGTSRHSNGGGCAISSVLNSVDVGSYAKVLGGNVSGNARIEDHALIL